MAESQIQAARFYNHHDIRIETVPVPEAKANEGLVDIAWAGICGTDLHEYVLGPLAIPRKENPHSLTGDRLPVTIGHEFNGHVRNVAAGTKDAMGKELKEGMPVMVDPRLNCASCSLCSGGSSSVCGKWGFLGLSGGGGGGFSTTIAVRTDMCYGLPTDMRLDHAVLIEPLAVARHALAASGVTIDRWKELSVLVLGGGPVGSAVLCNLRAAGCRNVIVSEPTAQRQIQCRDWAHTILDPMEQKVADECRAASQHHAGVDIVFDCAGIPRAMHDGFAALRQKGSYVNVSAWEEDFIIPVGVFLTKEITIKASMAYDEKDFSVVVADFVAGRFAGAESMITAKIALEDVVAEGFEQLVANKERHSKIIATPRQDLLELAKK